MNDIYYEKYKKYKKLYLSHKKLYGGEITNTDKLNEVLNKSKDEGLLSNRFVNRINKLFRYLNKHFSQSKLDKVYERVIAFLNRRRKRKNLNGGASYITQPALIDTTLNRNNYGQRKSFLRNTYELQDMFQIIYIIGTILSIPAKILFEVSK